MAKSVAPYICVSLLMTDMTGVFLGYKPRDLLLTFSTDLSDLRWTDWFSLSRPESSAGQYAGVVMRPC